jgi:hypothetical protein
MRNVKSDMTLRSAGPRATSKLVRWRNGSLFETIGRLFDHLVGEPEQVVRNRKPERLRSLEIDDNLARHPR